MTAMPDFSQGVHGFHHTLDSALAVLSDMNVPSARVTIRMAGKGYPSRWIAGQEPKPGEPLTAGVSVTLSIAGIGFFNALPVGMWETGGDAEPGTKELLELLDDPLEKAGHWLREGARLFDIHPDNFAACSRWISLFGLTPDSWPSESWYNLALLLPNLQALAGKEHGIGFALHLLLGLPLKEIRRSASFRYLPEDDWSLLGNRFSRLGVDSIAGDRVEDLAKLSLVIGPVPLSVYYEFQEPERGRLLKSVLSLVTACHQKHVVAWAVLDPEKAPKLGYEADNARLGINSYLGLSNHYES